MKKNIMRQSFNIVLILLSLCTISYAQVGIKTKNPLGVFHVDGLGNTTPVGANLSDDVIVSGNGKIAIGGSPTTGDAKLQLIGKNPFRLDDGTQAEGNILQAKDDMGNLSWVKPPPESWADVIRITARYRALNNGATKILETIVPYDGLYFVTIRWRGTINPNANANFPSEANKSVVSAYFHLRRLNASSSDQTNGDQLDTTEYYYSYYRPTVIVSFTVSLLGSLKANDKLILTITPATPVGTQYYWEFGGNSDYLLNPSVVIFKL